MKEMHVGLLVPEALLGGCTYVTYLTDGRGADPFDLLVIARDCFVTCCAWIRIKRGEIAKLWPTRNGVYGGFSSDEYSSNRSCRSYRGREGNHPVDHRESKVGFHGFLKCTSRVISMRKSR